MEARGLWLVIGLALGQYPWRTERQIRNITEETELSIWVWSTLSLEDASFDVTPSFSVSSD
jgi:hypothetical protein